MPALLRRPGSAGARPCQGRSSLDRACAPAEHGSYQEARTGKISQIKVSTLSGEPRSRTRRVVGNDRPDTLATWHRLAWVVALQDRYGEAEEMYRCCSPTSSGCWVMTIPTL